jgi:hypothetical protein
VCSSDLQAIVHPPARTFFLRGRMHDCLRTLRQGGGPGSRRRRGTVRCSSVRSCSSSFPGDSNQHAPMVASPVPFPKTASPVMSQRLKTHRFMPVDSSAFGGGWTPCRKKPPEGSSVGAAVGASGHISRNFGRLRAIPADWTGRDGPGRPVKSAGWSRWRKPAFRHDVRKPARVSSADA